MRITSDSVNTVDDVTVLWCGAVWCGLVKGVHNRAVTIHSCHELIDSIHL